MTIQSTTRRAILAGAASVPALAIASTSPAISSSPDAELVALARQLLDLEQQRKPACELTERNTKAFYEHMEAVHEDHKRRGTPMSDEEYIQCSALADAEHPLPFPREDDIYRQMDVVEARIRQLPAYTMRGWAAKATAAKIYNQMCGEEDLWVKPQDDAMWGDVVVRQLIDALIESGRPA